MREQNRRQQLPIVPIVISTIAAFVLLSVQLSGLPYLLWPEWLLLLVIFWSYRTPEQIGPAFALIVGVLGDVLQVQTFGVSSLGLVLLAFLINRSSHQMSAMTVWQQVLIVIAAASLYKLLTGWIFGLVDGFSFTLEYWYSLIGTAIAWPFVHISLLELHKALRLR